MAEPKKVLALSLSGIGNYLMHTPTWGALKWAHPDWHLTVWVAPRGTKALAAINPDINEVIEAPINNSVLGHIKTIEKLRRENFDIGLVMSPGQLVKSAAYLYLAGIQRRIGHKYPWRGQTDSSFLLTDSIAEDPKLHDIEQNLRLLEPLVLQLPSGPVQYSLEIPADAQARADEITRQIPGADSRKLIGFHAGSASGFEWKRWPKENFAAVGRELLKNPDAFILIFGGSEEADIKSYIKSELGDRAAVIDSNLVTTAAIIKRCHQFLTNDSGLMHIAAAVGVSTHALFGPTDERQTGPRGAACRVIRATGTQPAYNTESNPSPGNETGKPMLNISTGQVLRELGVIDLA